MAIYSEEEATKMAVEMIRISLQAGFLQPVVPNSYNDPASAGKHTGQFLGAMIKELSDQIGSL